MRETKNRRELHIQNKIFNIANLADLIKLFINQSNETVKISEEIRRKKLLQKGLPEINISEGYFDASHSGILLTLTDKSKFNFAFDDFEEVLRILAMNSISEVELNFSEKVTGARFVINLRQSGSGYVLVEGNEIIWVNESIKLVEDFLLTCQNQSLFIRKFKFPIISVIIAVLSYFLVNLIEFFIKTEVSFPKIVRSIFNDDILYYILLFVMISATPAVLIYRWLEKLYPVIEIRTGPKSANSEKDRRTKILFLVLIIIVPLVISVLLR